MKEQNYNNLHNSNVQKKYGGRKTGDRNKLTTSAKENLLKLFEEDIVRIHKSLNYVSMDERFVKLRPIIEILCKGDDSISIKTKEIIYENLKEQFKKLPFYIHQIPMEKRGTELRKILFYLDKEQIERIFKNNNKVK